MLPKRRRVSRLGLGAGELVRFGQSPLRAHLPATHLRLTTFPICAWQST